MLCITQPASDERPLDNGLYEYFVRDEPAGAREEWSRHRRADGLLVTRCHRDAQSFNTTLLVETLSEEPFADLRFRRCEIYLKNKEAETRAVYEFAGSRAIVTRTVNGETTAASETELPENTVVSPLMRVFLGPAIRRIAANRTATPVLVPFLEDPKDAEKLLLPTFDQRRATCLGPEQITFGGHSHAAHRYQYLGKQYDDQSTFWLDENGLLLRYLFKQNNGQVWDTRLFTAKPF
jgi:hypothetical protein